MDTRGKTSTGFKAFYPPLRTTQFLDYPKGTRFSIRQYIDNTWLEIATIYLDKNSRVMITSIRNGYKWNNSYTNRRRTTNVKTVEKVHY